MGIINDGFFYKFYPDYPAKVETSIEDTLEEKATCPQILLFIPQ